MNARQLATVDSFLKALEAAPVESFTLPKMLADGSKRPFFRYEAESGAEWHIVYKLHSSYSTAGFHIFYINSLRPDGASDVPGSFGISIQFRTRAESAAISNGNARRLLAYGIRVLRDGAGKNIISTDLVRGDPAVEALYEGMRDGPSTLESLSDNNHVLATTRRLIGEVKRSREGRFIALMVSSFGTYNHSAFLIKCRLWKACFRGQHRIEHFGDAKSECGGGICSP